MHAGYRISIVVTGLCVLFGTLASASAQQKCRLSHTLAQRLIAEYEGIPDSFVRVAYVLEGSVKTDEDGIHEATPSARAHYVKKVIEKGHARRRSCAQVFYHDSDLGWFLTVTTRGPFADHIEIWSEKRGYLCIE